MIDSSDQMISLLEEMRDLLRLLAEPAIAERDKKLRDTLREVVGKGNRTKAVILMNGTRTQVQIIEECGIHKGQLSELVKALRESELLKGDPKQPHLAISISSNFFDGNTEL